MARTGDIGTLELRLLGEMTLTRDGEPLALPQSKKTRALLAYLAVTGRPHRRERLCSLLWDVPDDPRGALRWSLSKLRSVVDQLGGVIRTGHVFQEKHAIGLEGGDGGNDQDTGYQEPF